MLRLNGAEQGVWFLLRWREQPRLEATCRLAGFCFPTGVEKFPGVEQNSLLVPITFYELDNISFRVAKGLNRLGLALSEKPALLRANLALLIGVDGFGAIQSDEQPEQG